MAFDSGRFPGSGRVRLEVFLFFSGLGWACACFCWWMRSLLCLVLALAAGIAVQMVRFRLGRWFGTGRYVRRCRDFAARPVGNLPLPEPGLSGHVSGRALAARSRMRAVARLGLRPPDAVRVRRVRRSRG